MAPRKQVAKGKKPKAKIAVTSAPVPQKRVIGKPFVKGICANPSGRPKGSRNKLDEVFVAAIYEAFEAGGAQAIRTVMEKDPTSFLNVVAKILPKHVRQQVQVNLTEISDSELANIAAGGRARAIETAAVPTQLN